ncbi:MAG TPA: hypothetical protein VEA18_01610, partial [Candidatus Kapabacteria bacterium]|nr:hypothetical protein [Candidatus Kapabacteria bacterium]
SGNPLRYTTSTEMVTVLAKDVKNRSTGVPLFQYFDANFTGTQAALPIPVSTTLIRAVRVQVDIERDANKSPVPFHIESLVHLRNIP